MATPIMGSEDFSYVLQRVPGAFAFLGTRPADGPAPPNHSNRMLVNEAALPVGVAMHVAVALDYLDDHWRASGLTSAAAPRCHPPRPACASS
jgi:metal-dependent amidase/aminoacylase/carboxypeptidase family protein